MAGSFTPDTNHGDYAGDVVARDSLAECARGVRDHLPHLNFEPAPCLVDGNSVRASSEYRRTLARAAGLVSGEPQRSRHSAAVSGSLAKVAQLWRLAHGANGIACRLLRFGLGLLGTESAST